MRRIPLVAALAVLLALGGLLKAEDTVVLSDGTVLTGQVMQETADQVIIVDQGVQRTLQRSLVSKVEFDTSPNASASNGAAPAEASQPGDTVPSAEAQPQEAAPAPGTDAQDAEVPPDAQSQAAAGSVVPAPAGQDEAEYAAGISGYYQVAPDEVSGYQQQGIAYEDLPVVFYIARRAQCAPGLVVSLRLSGMSWQAICMHFGLGPSIFYWRSLFGVNYGGPYGSIYFGFHRHPRRFWSWALLGFSDAEIVDCVNLRFETAWWHCRPYDVVRWRGMGHPFFWAGYGGRGRFGGRAWAGNRGAWGAGQRSGWNRAGRQGRVGGARVRYGAGNRNGAQRQHAVRQEGGEHRDHNDNGDHSDHGGHN